MKEVILKSSDAKLYKRYSFVGFFYVLFILGLVAIPVICITLPLFCFYTDDGSVINTVATFGGFKMFTETLLFKGDPITDAFISLGVRDISSGVFKMVPFETISQILFFALVIIFVLILLIDAILLLKTLFFMLVGQSKDPTSFTSICWTLGGFNLLFFGIIIGLQFLCDYYLVGEFAKAGITTKFGIGVEVLIYVFAGLSLLLPLIISIYSAAAFNNGYYIKTVNVIDLTPKEDEELRKHKEKEELAKTKLPLFITSLGGHAYSNNQYLKEIIIPGNISEIGASCFSNCGKINYVYIPTSVTKIGYNAFFNCSNLKTIVYQGTKEEWRKITRCSNWLYKAGTDLVKCKDGVYRVNPVK
jgi:hypothetical protein